MKVAHLGVVWSILLIEGILKFYIMANDFIPVFRRELVNVIEWTKQWTRNCKV